MRADVNGHAEFNRKQRPSAGGQQDFLTLGRTRIDGDVVQRWARTNPARWAASSLLNQTSAIVRL